MTKKPRPKKKYTPRDRNNLKLKFEPWRVNAVLQPLIDIIDQLETHGTLTTASDDRPMFKDTSDGCWYDSVGAFTGMIEAFEIHERRTGKSMRMDALRIILHSMETDAPIYSDETRAVRESIDYMRIQMMEWTINEAQQIVNDFHTKEALEKVM